MPKPIKPTSGFAGAQLNTQQTLLKISRYCAYQERSHKEVRTKLTYYGLTKADVDQILSHLITAGFLNEERYAKAFAGGKFRMMKWGRLKIQRELEILEVSPRNIQGGLLEISDTEYLKTLLSLVERKWRDLPAENSFKKKDRVARFVIGKGFEPDLVWGVIKDCYS